MARIACWAWRENKAPGEKDARCLSKTAKTKVNFLIQRNKRQAIKAIWQIFPQVFSLYAVITLRSSKQSGKMRHTRGNSEVKNLSLKLKKASWRNPKKFLKITLFRYPADRRASGSKWMRGSDNI